jgi:hypothetical protein
MKQTFAQAGYTYIRKFAKGLHVLMSDGGKLELWSANKNHASYGLKWRNTHLEFCRSL